MDDLNEKLNRLLSSPDGLQKIQSAMAALGGEGGVPLTPSPPSPPPAAPPAGEMNLPDLSTLAKLTPLLSGMGKEDDDTRLLRALRPYLHGPREKRLDETVQLLRLTKLLPLLQDQGVLGTRKGGAGDE